MQEITAGGMEQHLFSFGGGGILGFLSGFALKRIIKLAAIILGAFVYISRINDAFMQTGT